MNTYRVVYGCVVIICYLQQHGWAAPSQIENVQPSIQQTQVNNQLQEDILEDAINQALLNLPKARSHIQKRQTLSSLFEMIRQNMRNTLYPQFFCAASELRTDMRVNYFETLTDDEKVCYIPYVIPLTGDLLQTFNNMDSPLCADITFYKAYRMKILSKPFANDSDTQRFLCYTDRMIIILQFIQNLLEPTCPDFTDAQLLAIYDSYDDAFHTPENKYCILYSYFWNIWIHGIRRIPHEGYGLTLTSFSCDYPRCV